MQTFQPNCTLPISGPNFVNGVNVRGTLTIVWSCFSIILLCTWSIQHLNVCGQPRSPNLPFWDPGELYLTLRKFTWMFIAILAPELVTGKAVADLISARECKKLLATWASRDGVDFGLVHAFLADMGGFAVRFPPTTQSGDSNSITVPASAIEVARPAVNPHGSLAAAGQGSHDGEITSTTHGHEVRRETTRQDSALKRVPADITEVLGSYSAAYRTIPNCKTETEWQPDETNFVRVAQAMANIREEDIKFKGLKEWLENAAALQGNLWILDANQLLYARSVGIIRKLPNMSARDIADRNKSDSLVKFLSILQIGWLIIELAVRTAKGLPSSQLEILTLALAATSVLTFGLLFKKPKDVRVPYYITASRYPTVGEILRLADEGPFPYIVGRREYWIPNHSFHFAGPRWVYFRGFLVGSGLGATLFGAIHLIAWDFAFPTRGEQLAWQVSSVVTAAGPWVSIVMIGLVSLPYVIPSLTAWMPNSWLATLWWTYLVIMATAYTAARLFVSAEVFRTLYFLPPDGYVTTWSQNVPGIQ